MCGGLLLSLLWEAVGIMGFDSILEEGFDVVSCANDVLGRVITILKVRICRFSPRYLLGRGKYKGFPIGIGLYATDGPSDRVWGSFLG